MRNSAFGYIVVLLLPCLPLVVAAQPWEPEVLWDRQGQYDSSGYGYDILPLGDQNDDGFADWAVTATGHGPAGSGIGKVYEFYHGNYQLPQVPYLIMHERYAEGYVNAASGFLGDLNGDGYGDWFVEEFSRADFDTGLVKLFWGGPTADSLPDLSFQLYYQWSVDRLGDFNRDGADDLLIWDSGLATDDLYICYGGSSMDTLPDWVLSEEPEGIFRAFPSALGDFSGDGATDLLFYNINFNRVVVLLGGEAPDTLADYTWLDVPYRAFAGIPDLNRDGADEMLFVSAQEGLPLYWGGNPLNLEMDQLLSYYVVSLHGATGAGDVNGDGYSDFLAWGQRSGLEGGGVNLFLGRPWLYPEPVWGMAGSFGSPVWTAAGLGDVNGDGVGDWAVGFFDYDVTSAWRGRVIIYAGDSTIEADAEEPPVTQPSSICLSVYPNPFNSRTTVELELPKVTGPVELVTYNLLAQEVQRETIQGGIGKIRHSYDGSRLPSGVYLLRVEAGLYRQTQKLMVLR